MLLNYSKFEGMKIGVKLSASLYSDLLKYTPVYFSSIIPLIKDCSTYNQAYVALQDVCNKKKANLSKGLVKEVLNLEQEFKKSLEIICLTEAMEQIRPFC